MKEMRFCIKVVVTGKGNLQKPCQFIMDSHSAKAKREAHLYVPANVRVPVSRGELRRKPGALHESVNLLTTSKPKSALTTAIAKTQLNNCRAIVHRSTLKHPPVAEMHSLSF